MVNVTYVGSVAAITFFFLGKIVGNRVPADVEMQGLDIPEMGVHGYAPDTAHTVVPEVPSLSGTMSGGPGKAMRGY